MKDSAKNFDKRIFVKLCPSTKLISGKNHVFFSYVKEVRKFKKLIN